MCLPGLFSSPKAPPPPPPPKIELPPTPPTPAQADMKQQSQAAPASDQGMGGAVTRRVRKSLTIQSALGTF
jgi:hypothetical protein